MAKIISNYVQKKDVKRPNIHAKTKTSKNMSSKYYKKAYRGQGR